MKYIEIELNAVKVMSHPKGSLLKENYSLSLVRLNEMTHAKDRRRYR
jgi:hypothetical protein